MTRAERTAFAAMLEALETTLDYWDTCGFSKCDRECDCIVEQVKRAIKLARRTNQVIAV